MNRWLKATSAAAILGIAACSSGYGTTGYGAPGPSPTTGGGAGNLTVMNFLGWCAVSINGGAASTSATVMTSVPPGSVATLVAIPASSAFQIGATPWFGADQNDGGAASGTDVGSGASESSKATVTVNAAGTAQCVSVCCQEPGDGPVPCPTTSPCP